ncbi:MAG: TRAP transporter substrate-binding protein DctP [Gammaproteobacteria bacterium]|nr:TRAP transporter substrate-binding protein DctP [Gammaproteobacteria bacterium]NNJ78324.1 TRAP transporter substrate-binding protein DctP [Xanthomonadales bacterium]
MIHNKNWLLLAPLCLLFLNAPLMAQTIKIATIAPESSSWMRDMKAGAAAIQENTEGRVKFKFYGGGVQGNDKQVQRKMRTGQLHGGAFTSGGLNRFHKDADIFALPMLFDSIEEARFVRDRLEPMVRERLEEAGYVNFGLAAAGFAYMMSNRPARTLDDLKGSKVWIPEGDPVGFAALRALGVAPVVMPVTDVMTGLQTDLLDSITAPPVAAVVFQWHTQLKYLTDVPIAYVYAALLIDKRVFARVSAEDQVVVREVMEGIYRKFDKYGVTDNEEAMEALLNEGMQGISPNPDEITEWRQVVQNSHQKMADDGVFDPRLYERMQSLLEQVRAGE